MDELLPPSPQSYVRLTMRQLWEGLPLVVMAGFIFSFFCTPALTLFILGWPILAVLAGALTIAPAWAALLAQEADILEDKATNLRPMFRALPRYWGRSAKLGLLAAFPLVAGLLTLPNLAATEVPLIIWAGLAADILGALLLMTLSLYAFPLLILYDIALGPALRNALILSSRYLMHSLGLLSLAGLFLLSGLYLNSGLLFILPAVWGMFMLNNCRLVIHLEEKGSHDER